MLDHRHHRWGLALALALGACADPDVAPPAAPYLPDAVFEVRISQPDGPPRVETGAVDALGRAVTIACPTCHSQKGFGHPERRSGDPTPTTAFHQGLTVKHGTLACQACHEAGGYGALHTAEGKSLPYVEVQTLCRQCHGPQARDYDHGTHGGMNGYWDLARGPRQRHHCTVCHDPHAPRYVGMIPARGPVDPRFGGH